MTQAATAEPTKTPPEPPAGKATGATARRWPRPAGFAQWPVLTAAAVAGAVTVVTGPLSVVGIAGTISGVAVAAVPITVIVTSRAAWRRLYRPLPLLAMAAALTLFGVGSVRAAAWLYVLCGLSGVWLISCALAAGRRWPGVVLGGGAAWAGIIRGRTWITGLVWATLRSARAKASKSPAAPSTSDDSAASEPSGGPAHLGIGILGVGSLTVLVVVVFGSLLASADEEFAHVLSSVFTAPSPDLGGRLVSGIVVAAFASGAAYVARMPPRLDRIGSSEPRVVRPYEWAIPAGALVLLFALFTAVQFAALFGGENHLNLTEGLTYAAYARSGFAELVIVTVLTLGVLAAVARWAPRGTPSQRNLMRVLAGSICLFALVIVASALYRMDLYQEAYGLTRLRLLVTTFELWLGLLFVLVLVAGIRLRATWLPRAVVGTAVAALLGLAALNPDSYIAERNLERFERTGRIDIHYLGGLSADAVPVLTQLPEPERSCALWSHAHDLAEDDSWVALNLSRERARSVLDDHPVDEDALCADLRY